MESSRPKWRSRSFVLAEVDEIFTRSDDCNPAPFFPSQADTQRTTNDGNVKASEGICCQYENCESPTSHQPSHMTYDGDSSAQALNLPISHYSSSFTTDRREKSCCPKADGRSLSGLILMFPIHLFLYIFLLVLGFSSIIVQADQIVGIQGITQKCPYEGEVYDLQGSLRDPCFTCTCKLGIVVCERQRCPKSDGCFLIVAGERDGCCEVCKGCEYNNKTYTSGTEIIEGCSKITCKASVLTKSELQCYVPCKNPAPPKPGECCPTCDGCSMNGRNFENGEEFTLPSDPCVQCTCRDGSVECVKNSCPVLSCYASATYLEKGDCCPKCNGSRTYYISSRGGCLLGKKIYPRNESFRLDKCTNCTCSGTTSICDRVVCPPLDCERSLQVPVPDSCCPKCMELPQNSHCSWNGLQFKDGQRWDVNKCHSCLCDGGKIRCTEQRCPKQIKCKRGYKLRMSPEKCCPFCSPEDGVCTVFGDPHYQTFDGEIFDFQGACKYLLAADCTGNMFSIRVKNDDRRSRSFSWTRTVTLRVDRMKVTFGQRKRIKVNGKRVSLPFKDKAVKIYQDGYNAAAETNFGLKLIWDGYSFLEITAPHSLNNRLCGLCGNFNWNRTDDKVPRKSSKALTQSNFGKSWRVGGIRSCTKSKKSKKGPRGQKSRHKQKVCNVISSSIFSACHKAVNFHRFIEACRVDMKECPHERKCYCEVLIAYARACERAGVEMPNWRKQTKCEYQRHWKSSRRRIRRKRPRLHARSKH